MNKDQLALASLMADMKWAEKAQALSNIELAEELKIKVWSTQHIGSYELALVTEAIERLAPRSLSAEEEPIV